MKYTFLDGNDIKSDAETIEREMGNDKNVVFVYTNEKTALFAYIENLKDKGSLSDEKQLKLKICYERKGLDLTWHGQGRNSLDGIKITTMSQLIAQLDGSRCSIVVNDDKRSTLAEVVQQLVYIGYPLTKLEIMLRKEEKDYERAERFMKNIDALDRQLSDALQKLEKIKLDAYDRAYEENQKRYTEVMEACRTMKEQIEKARNRNLKIAVAATKKAGKSVVVNSMIGEELAPTSLELATPNTCVYTKSEDQCYHLDYAGETFCFDSADELYDKINEEFRSAQEKKAEGFAIPDMGIRYASKKNNFEAYTVYDTPGPDAAGTAHREHARVAIEQCDVAIFAIDYTKYLTESEAKYLKEIKEQFNEQNKFDSLIFIANKIDARYQDSKTSKSMIKSIDFLRRRLKDIDPAYNDCVIFGTSALQYFYIIEAEKVCGEDLRKSENLYNDLRPMIDDHEQVAEQLSFLDAQVGYMRTGSKLKNITLEDLRHYSGMPDLLEYVAYIAKTKARSELVNSVAYKIDSEQSKICGIMNWIENLKKLMDKNDREINKITEIFRELKEEVQRILKDEIGEVDIRGVEDGQGKGKTSCLKVYQQYFEKCRIPFSFQEIKNWEYDQIIEAFRKYQAIDNRGNVHEQFYKVLKRRYWEKFRDAQNKKDILYKDTDWLMAGMITDAVQEVRKFIIDREFEKEAGGTMKGLNEECNHVLNNRTQWLRKEIDECKEKLNKLDSYYKMPDIPYFDVVSSEIPELESPGEVKKDDLGAVLSKLNVLYKKLNAFERIKNFFTAPVDDFGREKRKAKQMSQKEFEKIFGDAKQEIEEVARRTGLSTHVQEDGKRMAQNIQNHIGSIEQNFRDKNQTLIENIERFTKIVDDREKYKDDQKKLEAEEEFIHMIAGMLKDFLDSWKHVVKFVGEESFGTQ